MLSSASFALQVDQSYADTQLLQRQFVNHFLTRFLRLASTNASVSSSSSSGALSGDVDGKQMIGDLVEDLQSVAHLPEWPVADELLSLLTATLRKVC